MSREQALAVLDEDRAYLDALGSRGADTELPRGARSPEQRAVHAKNVERLDGPA